MNDDEGSGIGWIINTVSSADNAEVVFPPGEGTLDTDVFGHGAYPMIIYEGQAIKLTWGSHASKTDQSYYYVNVLQFKADVKWFRS